MSSHGSGFMLPLPMSSEGELFSMSKTTERLERLKKQEAQLKARIQQEQARISASAKKERDGKLIALGHRRRAVARR